MPPALGLAGLPRWVAAGEWREQPRGVNQLGSRRMGLSSARIHLIGLRSTVSRWGRAFDVQLFQPF